MTMLTIKRGDTFSLARNIADDGISGSILDYTMRSQLRQESALVADLVPLADPDQEANPGDYLLMAISTDDWPTGRSVFDVEYTDIDGVIRKGPTVQLYVLSSPTYPAEEGGD